MNVEQRRRTSRSQATTRHESRDDSVPRVFFLSPAFDGAVERREHASPYTEVSSNYGCPGFYG